MNTALWVMQGSLAAIFLSTGLLKLLQPADKVRQLVPAAFPMPFVRLLAGLEIVGSIGIIFPWLTGILPILTPLTALCMSIVLVGAMIVHSRQQEWSKLPFVGVLLVVALVVVYSRFAVLS